MTPVPMVYNDIEPNINRCASNVTATSLVCGEGSVLIDGDIGPTQSLNINDPEQIRRFFVWHRDNGTVTWKFSRGGGLFNVSYIDFYRLSIPSMSMGAIGGLNMHTNNVNEPVIRLNTQVCWFSCNNDKKTGQDHFHPVSDD